MRGRRRPRRQSASATCSGSRMLRSLRLRSRTCSTSSSIASCGSLPPRRGRSCSAPTAAPGSRSARHAGSRPKAAAALSSPSALSPRVSLAGAKPSPSRSTATTRSDRKAPALSRFSECPSWSTADCSASCMSPPAPIDDSSKKTLPCFLGDRVALAVDRARRFERERHIAETLQRSLLPENLPRIPGTEGAARYLPAGAGTEVGGDWYEMLELPDGGIVLAMGDVVGRGVRAAALRADALQRQHQEARGRDGDDDLDRRHRRRPDPRAFGHDSSLRAYARSSHRLGA